MLTTRVRACASMVVLLDISTTLGVVLQTVPVGDPGNLPDGEHEGYGSVAYAFEIGKYEVTAAQYTEFLNRTARLDSFGLYSTAMAGTPYGCGITRAGEVGAYTYSVAPDFINRPVTHVSFWDACRFANWLHNGQEGEDTTETGAYTLTPEGVQANTVTRNSDWTWAVASEDEWYKAAYFKGGSATAGYYDYPTSSDAIPGQNLADTPRNNANYSTFPGTYPLAPPYYTTIVGQFQNSASPYGTFDQGGNVWEWNDAVVQGASHVLRGGSYASSSLYIPGSPLASWNRSSSAADGHSDLGFRIVYVPEPSTLVLLMLTLGVLRSRE